MEIADACEGDVYVDDSGKLWRVTLVVHEPTVTVEEVEGTLHDPNRPIFPAAAQVAGVQLGQIFSGPYAAEIRKIRRSHFIGDKVWEGWWRIWRRRASEED